jgi:hypothetical protein
MDVNFVTSASSRGSMKANSRSCIAAKTSAGMTVFLPERAAVSAAL